MQEYVACGKCAGRWAEWVSERIRKRTGFLGLTRFEEEGLGEKERACLDVDMMSGFCKMCNVGHGRKLDVQVWKKRFKCRRQVLQGSYCCLPKYGPASILIRLEPRKRVSLHLTSDGVYNDHIEAQE